MSEPRRITLMTHDGPCGADCDRSAAPVEFVDAGSYDRGRDDARFAREFGGLGVFALAVGATSHLAGPYILVDAGAQAGCNVFAAAMALIGCVYLVLAYSALRPPPSLHR